MAQHWEILAQAETMAARSGTLTLAHGKVQTPVFMPVGTYGAVKSMDPTELEQMGTQILLGNTYHLYLRPGLELLDKFKGLHGFMRWNRPILTDSGGFQVFSLSQFRKINDEGVTFRSHLNGDKIHFTPELSAKIQQAIGSDIAMILDECVSLPNSEPVIEAAVHRSLAWSQRFLDVQKPEWQKVFGIVQGGTNLDLRLYSLQENAKLGFDGIAVGGLSVGESHEEMVRVLRHLAPHYPANVPRYLMGVGMPIDLLEAVAAGVDMFDCVLPTRNARNAYAFSELGPIKLRNEKYKFDERPISESCACSTCQRFSRAYLRHLFQTGEILGCRLATVHNLHYYHTLMHQMRQALRSGNFEQFYQHKRRELIDAYLGSGQPAAEQEREKDMEKIR